MKDPKEVFDEQLKSIYYTIQELKYSINPGYFLSVPEIDSLLTYKDELLRSSKQDKLEVLPLKTFNSEFMFFANCKELISLRRDFLNSVHDDVYKSYVPLTAFDKDKNTFSRLLSELEGSVNIENVPTTRKRTAELIDKKIKPETRNDIIVINMNNAIGFVSNKPEFSKENLRKLYDILSNGCLDEDDLLKSDGLYRYDDVEVDGYKGCPVDKIDSCMDSLFDFVNSNLSNPKYTYLLSHIAHYYLIYIHPYFDYNGRTARMVSLWISLLSNSDTYFPYFISEAINQGIDKQ